MKKNKFFTLFVIIIFSLSISKTSLAQEEKTIDYEHILAGSCVTQDGFFFTEEGMIKLVVNTQEKIKLITLDSQKQIDLLKIDLKKCSDSKESELRIQREMYQSQLSAKQEALDAYKKEAFWRNIQGSLTGLALGIVIGVSAFYFISNNR